MTEYVAFEPSVKPLAEESEEDIYYIYGGDQILVKSMGNKLTIPRLKDLVDIEANLLNKQCMGRYKGVNCYSAEVLKGNWDQGLKLISLMDYSRRVGEEDYLLASKGKLLLDWYSRNQYCGKCGSRMENKDSVYERSMICHNCSSATWPRTSPAILVSIIRDGKILLANNRNYPDQVYSVLAGFVEYGETFEDCVRREVYEEVGLEVDNIRYFGSKPWPFPNSMMVAYIADYKSGEIRIDEDELNHADWYDLEDLPRLFENPNSIACDLISYYRKEYKK